MRYLIPLELWQLKSKLQQILFEDSFLRLAAVRRLGSGLFHSITGWKKIFKNVMFRMK